MEEIIKLVDEVNIVSDIETTRKLGLKTLENLKEYRHYKIDPS
jgi:hypothetical protein